MPPCNLKMASRQSPVSIIGFVATRNKPRRDRLAEFEKYQAGSEADKQGAA
jgi:hypothetical protein